MKLHRPVVLAAITTVALFSAAALGAGTASLLYLKEIAAIEPVAFDTSAALRAAHALPDSGPLPVPEQDAPAPGKAEAATDAGFETSEAADVAGDDEETDGEPVWRVRRSRLRGQRASGRGSGDTSAQGQGQAQAQSEGSTCTDKIDGVTRHSSTRFSLSRSFANTYIRDQDTAAQQGQAAWRKNRQQENVGIRIGGLRCAPRAAGLRNNDVIREINGRPMTSSVNAFAAYRDVKSGDRFSVKLKRDGQLMTIQYTIQ